MKDEQENGERMLGRKTKNRGRSTQRSRARRGQEMRDETKEGSRRKAGRKAGIQEARRKEESES